MICGSGGSKSGLAKAAGAKPSGQMSDEQLHAVVARSTSRTHKCKKMRRHRALLGVQMSFCVGGTGIVHLVKSQQNMRVL